MEMHQLRYFVAVAETGNFTRAAKQCFVSQPSLSQQIQKLEEELGQPLLDRLGRRAELTAAGRAFFERARRILLEVEDAARVVREESGTGRLRFGVIPSVAPYVVPELLPRLHERLPETRIDVFEDFRARLIDEVVAGKIDAALATMTPENPAIESEPLLSEPLLVAMKSNHPLAEKRDLKSSDLTGQRLILLGDSSSLALQTRRFFGDHHIDLEITSRCAQVKTVKLLIAAGLGMAILPKMAAGRDNVPGLVYRALADANPHRELVLVRHRQRYHGRAEETFAEVLRELLAERAKAAG
jgi:LysR family hydrogen peroxide-inducible transcriptional activator